MLQTITLTLPTVHEKILEAMRDHGGPELSVQANDELARRRETRSAGPVLVEFGGAPGKTYAYLSQVPVALGDRVVVPTRFGFLEATVVEFGSGEWHPRDHGPLKTVVRRL